MIIQNFSFSHSWFITHSKYFLQGVSYIFVFYINFLNKNAYKRMLCTNPYTPNLNRIRVYNRNISQQETLFFVKPLISINDIVTIHNQYKSCTTKLGGNLSREFTSVLFTSVEFVLSNPSYKTRDRLLANRLKPSLPNSYLVEFFWKVISSEYYFWSLIRKMRSQDSSSSQQLAQQNQLSGKVDDSKSGGPRFESRHGHLRKNLLVLLDKALYLRLSWIMTTFCPSIMSMAMAPQNMLNIVKAPYKCSNLHLHLQQFRYHTCFKL